MRDAVIRTVVPFVVGYLITWAAQAGLDLPENDLTNLLTVLVGGAYYAIAHAVEKHVSAPLGRVLLSGGLASTTPTYQRPSRLP